MGCVWFIDREMELRYWLVPGSVKNNRINKLNKKRSLIPSGLRACLHGGRVPWLTEQSYRNYSCFFS